MLSSAAALLTDFLSILLGDRKSGIDLITVFVEGMLDEGGAVSRAWWTGETFI